MNQLTPAEYKTAHESIGVSTAFLAARVGVHASRIWDYEKTSRKRPVPEQASEGLMVMTREFDEVAIAIAKAAEEHGVIHRYVNLADFYRDYPLMDGWGPLAHGLVIAEAQRIARLGVEYLE